MQLEELNDVLTVKEMKAFLRIGTNKAYELIKDKRIGHFRCGEKYYIPKKCIIEYINNSLDMEDSYDGLS